MKFKINLSTPDNGEKFVVAMSNATLTTIAGYQAQDADLTRLVQKHFRIRKTPTIAIVCKFASGLRNQPRCDNWQVKQVRQLLQQENQRKWETTNGF